MESNANWLSAQPDGDTVRISVNPAGLSPGTYNGQLTLRVTNPPGFPPAQVPVTLMIFEHLFYRFLPVVNR